MPHDDQEDPATFHEENSTIGMRLYRAMAAVSEVAHNAENAAEIGGDASGEWGVAADTLWQIKAMLETIMADLGVKTPADMRKIQAHDFPPGAADNDQDVPF